MSEAQEEKADKQAEESEPQQVTETKEVGEQAEKDENQQQSKEQESSKHYPGGERFDPSGLPKSEDASEIRKQVEFYFSDSNLSQDKFLYTMVSENEGWADLRCVANFKRMRRFQPYTLIVSALRDSEVLEIDEPGERVKRKSPLKPFTSDNSPLRRSVYVKGFPAETKTLQIELEKFFEQFGNIKVVRMRRTDEGAFKGSVFVEFSTLEEQSTFLESAKTDAAPKYDDADLEIMSKKAYLDMKDKEYGGKFPESTKKPFNAFAKRRDDDRGRRGRGGRGRGDRGRGRGGNRPNDRNAEKSRSNPTEEQHSSKDVAPETKTGEIKVEATETKTGEKRAAEEANEGDSKKPKVDQ